MDWAGLESSRLAHWQPALRGHPIPTAIRECQRVASASGLHRSGAADAVRKAGDTCSLRAEGLCA